MRARGAGSREERRLRSQLDARQSASPRRPNRTASAAAGRTRAMPPAQPRRPGTPQSQPKNYRPFCLSVKGHVKMLRLILTVTSMTFFILAQAPEPYIVITGFEVTIIFFFIVLYLFRLDRLLKCLFWPLLDIINSLVTTIFLTIVSVLALIPETTTMTVLGGLMPGIRKLSGCTPDRM
ncbi:chemokine-like factor isoform X2 [Tenrec ecaudatus]|uniref:chemokine-like factor isoform X2 n=1 Tax=Tenrec ecaudatus TaxID=94439 RepID=UPI003F5AB96A